MAPTKQLPTGNDTKADTGGRSGSVHRTLDILEAVAACGGCTARELADSTGLPLPTVYRLVRELIEGDYLVHIREEKRFELGYKLHELGRSLHEQIGVPREVRAEVSTLHQQLGVAAYFALHRGSQIVVVFTADSPECPRLPPLKFGYHDAPHASALGKILLAHLEGEKRSVVLPPEPMPRFTKATITGHRELTAQLSTVTHRGVAWEFGEMEVGSTCAAAAVWGAPGWLIGSVAISADSSRLAHRRAEVEAVLRATAVRLGRHYRPEKYAPAPRTVPASAPRPPLDVALSTSDNGTV